LEQKNVGVHLKFITRFLQSFSSARELIEYLE